MAFLILPMSPAGIIVHSFKDTYPLVHYVDLLKRLKRAL